jgi:hypothetical protein
MNILNNRILTLKKTIFLLTFSIFAFALCNAQESIQSGDYYKYSAENADLSKAQSDALSGLVQQVQSFVKTVLRHEKSEVGGAFRDSTVSSVIAISSVKLTNVQEKVEKAQNGLYRVTKFISKAAVQEMFDQRKVRILELLDVAQTELSNCKRVGSINLEIVFKDLYWAYLLASIHPYQITYTLKDESGEVTRNSTDVLEGIRYLFETISSKIQVVQINRIEETNLVWKCRFEYGGLPISSLNFSFYDGVGQTDGKVKNGQSIMTFFFPDKDKKEREVDLAIEFKAQDEMDELLQFAEEMTQSKFSSKNIILVLGSEGKKIAIPEKKKELLEHDTTRGNGIPKAIQEVISQGTSLKTTLEALRNMVKKKRIIVGRREDFESLDGMFGLVLDESGTVALIIEQKGKWMDLIHSKTIDTKELVGKKITWIETHEK